MFQTLALLIIPTLCFRLLGALGVTRLATWQVSFAHGLAVLVLFTGASHFLPDSVEAAPSHDDLTAMVPSFVPFPDFMVYLTGVLELLGAVGLILNRTRPLAGIGLAVLFVLMFPANIYAAVEDIPLNGEAPTPLWFRLPEQIVFIAVALWAAGVPMQTAVSARLRSLVPARSR
ncbi:DoxX family membrane protein [Nocardia uniformis]|uniref:DoxX family membrane protein n=1 Tax=Nocardia uniformis TaxID=53432 RepID=A0A849CH96_9NOCA|nr:DoxX family protein [Nocardia uniformis]NNH75289.1 DoxX family membrane protein [Nocardia uniformis]